MSEELTHHMAHGGGQWTHDTQSQSGQQYDCEDAIKSLHIYTICNDLSQQNNILHQVYVNFDVLVLWFWDTDFVYFFMNKHTWLPNSTFIILYMDSRFWVDFALFCSFLFKRAPYITQVSKHINMAGLITRRVPLLSTGIHQHFERNPKREVNLTPNFILVN